MCCVFVLKDEEEKKRPKDRKDRFHPLIRSKQAQDKRGFEKSKSFVVKRKTKTNWRIHPHKNKNEEMVRKYNKTGKYSKKNKYKEWKDDDDDGGGGDLSDLSFDDDYEDDGSNARKQKRTAVVDDQS